MNVPELGQSQIFLNCPLHLLGIAIIIFVAVITRFYNIKKTGLNWWDEGSYFAYARSILSIFKFLKDKDVAKYIFKPCNSEYYFVNRTSSEEQILINKFNQIVEIDASAYIYIKPLQAYICAIGLYLSKLKDWGLILPNAVLGTLNIILVYCFLNQYIGQIAAISASLILTISGSHLYHSRSGSAELKVAFFCSLAFCSYYSSIITWGSPISLIWLLITGISINLCGALSSSWYIILPPFFIFSEILTFILFHYYSFEEVILRIILSIFIYIGMFLVWEIPHLLRYVLFPALKIDSYLQVYFKRTYAGILMQLALFKKEKTSSYSYKIPFSLDWGFYIHYFYISEGPIICFLLLTGLGLCFYKLTLLNILLLIFFLGIFTFFTIMKWRVGRGSLILRPLMAIIAGLPLAEVYTIRKDIFWLLAALILFYGLYKIYPILICNSTFKEATEFVKSNPASYVSVFNMQLGKAYFPCQKAIIFTKGNEEPIKKLCSQGEIKYFILSSQGKEFFEDKEMLQNIQKHKPAWERPDLCIHNPLLFAEVELVTPPCGNNIEFKLNPHKPYSHVQVYDLDKYFFDSSQLNSQGEILFAQKMYDKAKSKFKTAIEIKPDFALAYNNLGVLIWEINKDIEALSFLEKAIKLSLEKDFILNYLQIIIETKEFQKLQYFKNNKEISKIFIDIINTIDSTEIKNEFQKYL